MNARMKVVPSLGSALPAPAARSTSPSRILITFNRIQPDSTGFNRIQPDIQPDSTRYSTGFNQVFNRIQPGIQPPPPIPITCSCRRPCWIPFSWMTLPSSPALRIPGRGSTLRRPSQRPPWPAGRRQDEGGPFPRLGPSSAGSTIHAGHRRRSCSPG